MKDRIKKIRKSIPEHGKTQESFAKFLGIPKQNLASYETGRRTPSDAVIQLICQKCYNIREDWLRTGEGDMEKPITKSQEIGDFVSSIMHLPDKDFKKRFIHALQRLDEKNWKHLEEITNKLLNEEEG